MTSRSLLKLSASAQGALIRGARNLEPVHGLTHGFYKYPARFSPAFVRAAIKTFTKPGDLVLDPHVGGGTTLVEALATGRDAIGVDISALAEFVTKVKTTVYSEAELDRLERWARCIATKIDVYGKSTRFADYAELGYYKHLDHPARWRLRKSIEQAIRDAIRLGTPRLEAFGRCVVLRTAQWALDGRSKQASAAEFRASLEETAVALVEGARDLRAAVKGNGRRPLIGVLRRSVIGLENDTRLHDGRTPRLVLTSPPYPGCTYCTTAGKWTAEKKRHYPSSLQTNSMALSVAIIRWATANIRRSRLILKISLPRCHRLRRSRIAVPRCYRSLLSLIQPGSCRAISRLWRKRG